MEEWPRIMMEGVKGWGQGDGGYEGWGQSDGGYGRGAKVMQGWTRVWISWKWDGLGDLGCLLIAWIGDEL